MAPTSFSLDLDHGYQRRHQWQARIAFLACKLDKIEGIPEEAAEVLRELFEAIGERA